MANEIIKVLDALCEKFGVAIDWTSDNVLPYVQELCGKYIKYEIWTSVAWIIVCSVIFVVCLIIALKAIPKAKEVEWYDCDPYTVLAIGSIVCTVIAGITLIIVAGIQVFEIITCLTFPEKMIFEYVQGLMQSSN